MESTPSAAPPRPRPLSIHRRGDKEERGRRRGSSRRGDQGGYEMLAASICREVHFTVLSSTTMESRVPRCLFGQPNSRETVELLQEALDAERSKFARRWGVDPCSEDKENNYQRNPAINERSDHQSPRKRNNPYSKQTSIHDYWRARKVCDVNKKPLMTSSDASKQQNMEQSTKSSKTTKVLKKSN